MKYSNREEQEKKGGMSHKPNFVKVITLCRKMTSQNTQPL